MDSVSKHEFTYKQLLEALPRLHATQAQDWHWEDPRDPLSGGRDLVVEHGGDQAILHFRSTDNPLANPSTLARAALVPTYERLISIAAADLQHGTPESLAHARRVLQEGVIRCLHATTAPSVDLQMWLETQVLAGSLNLREPETIGSP